METKKPTKKVDFQEKMNSNGSPSVITKEQYEQIKKDQKTVLKKQ